MLGISKGIFIKKLLGLIFLLNLLPSFTAHGIEVVVNHAQDNKSLITSLSKYQLRQIYLMRQKYWPDGSPIIVYALPSDSALHQDFSKNILNMFPYQLDRVWSKLIYSGLGKGPIIIESEQALINALKTTQGAIGYVRNFVTEEKLYVIQIK